MLFVNFFERSSLPEVVSIFPQPNLIFIAADWQFFATAGMTEGRGITNDHTRALAEIRSQHEVCSGILQMYFIRN